MSATTFLRYPESTMTRGRSSLGAKSARTESGVVQTQLVGGVLTMANFLNEDDDYGIVFQAPLAVTGGRCGWMNNGEESSDMTAGRMHTRIKSTTRGHGWHILVDELRWGSSVLSRNINSREFDDGLGVLFHPPLTVTDDICIWMNCVGNLPSDSRAHDWTVGRKMDNIHCLRLDGWSACENHPPWQPDSLEVAESGEEDRRPRRVIH